MLHAAIDRVWVILVDSLHDPQVLLVRAADMQLDAHKGLWKYPGGPVQFGEEPIYAAVRIVHDTTGITCRAVAELPSFEESGEDGSTTTTYVFLALVMGVERPFLREHVWMGLEKLASFSDLADPERMRECVLEARAALESMSPPAPSTKSF